MTKTLAPAKTPGVAIARVLRGLGLKQGSDFRVKGEYKNGERTGTRVAVFGRQANQTVADNADRIESHVIDNGFMFYVSVYFTPSGRVWVHMANYGRRTRQTHFLSNSGRTENTATEAPQTEPTLDDYAEAAPLTDAVEQVIRDFPKGQRVQGADNYGVACMGAVNGVAWGAVTQPGHPNFGRTWVDVDWNEMDHNQGTGRRSRPFSSDLIKY